VGEEIQRSSRKVKVPTTAHLTTSDVQGETIRNGRVIRMRTWTWTWIWWTWIWWTWTWTWRDEGDARKVKGEERNSGGWQGRRRTTKSKCTMSSTSAFLY